MKKIILVSAFLCSAVGLFLYLNPFTKKESMAQMDWRKQQEQRAREEEVFRQNVLGLVNQMLDQIEAAIPFDRVRLFYQQLRAGNMPNDLDRNVPHTTMQTEEGQFYTLTELIQAHYDRIIQYQRDIQDQGQNQGNHLARVSNEVLVDRLTKMIQTIAAFDAYYQQRLENFIDISTDFLLKDVPSRLEAIKSLFARMKQGNVREQENWALVREPMQTAFNREETLIQLIERHRQEAIDERGEALTFHPNNGYLYDGLDAFYARMLAMIPAHERAVADAQQQQAAQRDRSRRRQRMINFIEESTAYLRDDIPDEHEDIEDLFVRMEDEYLQDEVYLKEQENWALTRTPMQIGDRQETLIELIERYRQEAIDESQRIVPNYPETGYLYDALNAFYNEMLRVIPDA